MFIPWTTEAKSGQTEAFPEKLPKEAQEPMPARIEALIDRTGLSYYDLAKAMGVTRTTVHDVRKGQRKASKKFIAKFDLAEKRLEAARLGDGILTRKGETLLLFALRTPTPPEERLNPLDILKVRPMATESDPEPQSMEIKLVKPPRAQGMAAIVKALMHEKCDDLIIACLEGEYASQNFIESVSPSSYITAIKKCVQLILGPEWQKELQVMAQTGEQRRKRPSNKSGPNPAH